MGSSYRTVQARPKDLSPDALTREPLAMCPGNVRQSSKTRTYHRVTQDGRTKLYRCQFSRPYGLV